MKLEEEMIRMRLVVEHVEWWWWWWCVTFDCDKEKYVFGEGFAGTMRTPWNL